MKPQFKNSKLNVDNTIDANTTYLASAWISHKNGIKTSEQEKQNINHLVKKMLADDINGISIQIQKKDDNGNFVKVSTIRLFLEDPNYTFKKAGDIDVGF